MKRSILNKQRGFTAIELTAVASIIAILALILLPIVRKRLEVARQTAAADDMRSVEVAEMLANSDTSYFFRLSDLDNPGPDLVVYNSGTAAQKAQEMRKVPNALWNRVLRLAGEQSSGLGGNAGLGLLGSTWAGPYVVFNKTKFLPLSALVNDARTRVVNIDPFPPVTTSANTGPIPIFTSSSANIDPFNDDVANGEVTPVDPWGQPYIFFGPGKYGIGAGATALSNAAVTESNFGVSIVYSTGPDGLPGNLAAPTSLDFYRETSVLGTGDDLYRVF